MRSLLLVLGALPLLSAACRSSSGPAAAEPPRPEAATLTSGRGATASTGTKERMRDHDVHGVRMRDAVARGALEDARSEARVLAALRVESAIEPAWQGNLEGMNAAAAYVATATDLGEASRGVAALARTCGGCHATLGGPAPAVGEPPGEEQGAGLALRMQRHDWAAARLWDGLVTPSDDAWRAGARVLADAPLERVPLGERPPPPSVRPLAGFVHALAEKAHAAEAPVDRSAVYGELLATCAACHGRLGGGPPSER